MNPNLYDGDTKAQIKDAIKITGPIQVAAPTNLADHKEYVTSTGFQSLLLLAPVQRLTIQNPVNSGKLIVITCIETANTASALVQGELRINPTTITGTSIAGLPLRLTNLVAQNSGALIRFDAATTMLGGGRLFKPFAVPIGRSVHNISPIILEPGITLGISLSFGVAVSSNLDVWFYEESQTP